MILHIFSLSLHQFLLLSSFPNPPSHIPALAALSVFSSFSIFFPPLSRFFFSHFSPQSSLHLTFYCLLHITSSFSSSSTLPRRWLVFSALHPNALLSTLSPAALPILMFSMHTMSNRGFCHRLCTLLKVSRSLIHVSWALWGLNRGGWELVASWRPFKWHEPCLSHHISHLCSVLPRLLCCLLNPLISPHSGPY